MTEITIYQSSIKKMKNYYFSISNVNEEDLILLKVESVLIEIIIINFNISDFYLIEDIIVSSYQLFFWQ